MPSPIENFDGIARICSCLPPDTEGDVGPNHYMEWVNAHYAVYSKTGTVVVPPTAGNTIFTQHSDVARCETHEELNADDLMREVPFAGRGRSG